jgi:uncharacterized protein with von Willebrand factor type A (vWA) domain
VPTGDLLRRLDERWKVAIVGDAAMHPAELLEPNGGDRSAAHLADARHHVAATDRDAFRAGRVDQPRAREAWDDWQTVAVVRRLFPMFHLSIDGLGRAVQALVGART